MWRRLNVYVYIPHQLNLLTNTYTLPVSPHQNILLVERVVQSLNPRAKVLRCSRAAVDVDSILTYIGDGEGVADCGIVDDHKDFVRAAEGEGKEGAHECEGVDCEHPSHDHSHGHEADGGDCNDPDCSDPSHSHSHSHEAHDGDCNDPDCSDPSHSHSHSHSHSPTHAHGAIGSFVFRSRRPFHPSRLSAFVKSHLSGPSPTALLRAKGFCWMANSHTSALYFAYAGVTFEMQVSPLVLGVCVCVCGGGGD